MNLPKNNLTNDNHINDEPYSKKDADNRISDTSEYNLQLCEKCNQMTNHLNGICQKCDTSDKEQEIIMNTTFEIPTWQKEFLAEKVLNAFDKLKQGDK